MFFIWAYMHMGCIIGLVLFALFLSVELIIYLKPAKITTKALKPLNKPELVKVL